MSEKRSTTKDIPAPHIEGAPDVIQLDAIEELRKAQQEAHWRQVTMGGQSTNDIFDEVVKKHLDSHGLSEDDGTYNGVYALLREVSIDRASQEDWILGKKQKDTDDRRMPLRLQALQSLRASYETTPTPDPITNPDAPVVDTPPTPDNQPDQAVGGEQPPAPDPATELTQVFERLETLRGDLAILAARKSGKAFNIFNEKYNQALAAYNNQLIAAGRLNEARLEVDNPGRTYEERNIDTIGYLLDEQRELREATIAEFQSSKTNKFVEWFNRGGKVTRIAKGIALGAPAAVLAAFAAPAGAAAAVVTGGVMGARFTRGYARHDKQRGTNISLNGIDQAGMQTAVQSGGANRRLENAVTQLTGRFDTDKKHEQEKRRKSLYWGLGGIALGTTIGAAYNAYHHFSPRDSYQGMKDGVGSVKDKLGIGDSSNTPPAGTKIPGPNQAPTTGSSIDITPDAPVPADVDTMPEAQDWSDAASTVDPGEGWYQTFQDMNIPSDEWQDLLNNVGPELQQEGWAYHMPSGDWGISRPGELPASMLQLIQDSRH